MERDRIGESFRAVDNHVLERALHIHIHILLASDDVINLNGDVSANRRVDEEVHTHGVRVLKLLLGYLEFSN